MNILAVTCYTGGEELVAMTERCISGLADSCPDEIDLAFCTVGQGASRLVNIEPAVLLPKNIGFAAGMNAAIKEGRQLYCEDGPDYVLCFNNDLEFPDPNWLRRLIEIAEEHPGKQVLVPATDSTATKKQSKALNHPSHSMDEASAYCWLVPFAWCKWLHLQHGFWLFSEDFAPAYGEDNWTAYLFNKQFGPKAFRYVPRSFVKHLRARTARTVAHSRAKSTRTLIEKFKKELQDESLPADSRQWARRYIAILTPA